MRYRFDHPLTARIACGIMKFWGVNAILLGRTLQEGEPGGRGGFEFFARLYDGTRIK